MTYTAPLQDICFWIEKVFEAEHLTAIEGREAMTPELIEAVLDEAGKFASNVLLPLQQSGDREGCTLKKGVVSTPTGWKDAYSKFVNAGWNTVPFSQASGGQGLPRILSASITEMWNSANMAFALCPLLTQSAIELLEQHGTQDQKNAYLTKLISGEWTGTMCMTEPHAGSDVGAVHTTAQKDGDHYRIKGGKIYITYGEHDLTENIIHMVLARTEGAPEGIKGLSLFLVPKYLVSPMGIIGEKNDVVCASLEKKMGIHASPTATLMFGEKEGAIGYLIGEENRGIEYMFTMMNSARLSVGMQGVAMAEHAYQMACTYAKERVQGRQKGEEITIIHHPDVKRMLLNMRAHTQALRGLAYYIAAKMDHEIGNEHDAEYQRNKHIAELLIPVIKAYGTDSGFKIASMGMQVHGGAGYIEETGIAQLLRDSRIAMIYEGTNGIQAMDLITRKIMQEDGIAFREFTDDVSAFCADCCSLRNQDVKDVVKALRNGLKVLSVTTRYMRSKFICDQYEASCAGTAYLQLFGIVGGGYALARAAATADRKLEEDPDNQAFYEEKMLVAQYYMKHIMPETLYLSEVVTADHSSIGQFNP